MRLLKLLLALTWCFAGSASAEVLGIPINPSFAGSLSPVSVSVAANGTTITVNWPVAMSQGAGWSGSNLNVDGTQTGDNIAPSWSGSGTATWTGTLSGTKILQGATPDLDFDGTANSVEATSGGADLGAMLNFPIKNDSTQSASPTPDLLWWKLNEGSGTSITGDASGGGDDGMTDTDWVTGKSGSGSALDFNGTTDDAVTTSAITYGGDVITVALWLYFDSTTGTRIIAESSDNLNTPDQTWGILLDGGNLNVVQKGVSALYRTSYVTAPSTGAWVHLLVVFDASTSEGINTMYLDGVLQSPTHSGSRIASANFSAQTVNLGRRASANTFFLDGRIDDCRIYLGDVSADVVAIKNDAQ